MDQCWVVAVDMGYGHQRAAYPLRKLSPTGEVIIANNYAGIPKRDFGIWNNSRKTYEFFSQMSNLPIVGSFVFGMLDKFQEIPPFYPHRDLSAPNIQVRQQYYLIRHGWGKHLIDYLNTKDIPLITTFFATAFFAEEHKFKNDIYVVVCDSDISRTWVPMNPQKSRIKYLAPVRRVVERLQLYGVKEENIFLTGFPLPEENIGDNFSTLHADLAERLVNLDPEERFRHKYSETVKQFIKQIKIHERHHHPLTLTFAVGGAGAQRSIAQDILFSLKKKLLTGQIKLNLIAGTRNDVCRYFQQAIEIAGVQKALNRNLHVLFELNKQTYFQKFNDILRSSDALWTKPSELVFYSALGLPIIMAPSLGSQEIFNRSWLKTVGAGITQNDPRFTDEWFFDWVNSGWLAQAALEGFLDGRQYGVQNIADVIFRGVKHPAADDSLL